MLSATDEETNKRPMAVRSGRRSGRASATILRKDAAVEDVPPALDKREAGRRRERTERCIGEDGGGVGDTREGGRGSGRGAWRVEPATKERLERNGGHGGYRRLVEGCANAIRTERAPPPRAPRECAGVVTRRRRCKENIKSKSTRARLASPAERKIRLGSGT
jgi:hypothetical protein